MASLDIPEIQIREIPKQLSPFASGSFEITKLKGKVLWQLLKSAVSISSNPIRLIKLVQEARRKYQTIYGAQYLNKVAKVNNRYHWRLAAPGFPSAASNKRVENEINRLVPGETRGGLQSIIFAITKKCPLNCEHCFEWNNLNGKEQLSTSDIIQTVKKYQECGTTQMMFSGGEPMLRINDIYKILSSVKTGTDFWIITSGLGLKKEKAQRLKASGLTGVLVSLDHHEASKHDKFRGFEGSYNDAIQAVVNANDAGLVSALSLCARNEYISEENLSAYMNLAKTLGVSFIQIIEARPAGRYAGKDVKLNAEAILILEKTYLEYNSLKEFQAFPIINYFGYHQRRVGCFGGGNRFFYIDTDGNAQSCPVCSNKVGKVIDHSAVEIISALNKTACFDFERSVL